MKTTAPQTKLPLRIAIRSISALSRIFPRAVAQILVHVAAYPRHKYRLNAAHKRSGEARKSRTRSGLHYQLWGHSGPLVVCLHGWESCGAQFQGLATHLANNDFRVVALDARAHGNSSGKTATPIDFVEGLKELTEILGEEVHLIGHSMGGFAAMLAVREGLPCLSLTVIAPLLQLDNSYRHINHILNLSEAAFKSIVALGERMFGRSFTSMNLLTSPPPVATLVIHDRSDKMVLHEDSQQFANAWPQVRLITTEGMGHHRILASPDVWRIVEKALRAPDIGAGT